MSILNNSLLLKQAADSTPAEDPVTRSLRFDEGTPTLSRTPTSSGSQRKFTLSMWIKRTRLDSTGYETIWGSEVGGANYCILTFYEDCLQFQSHVSGHTYTLKSNAKYRDVSAFYHITLSVDTDQELETNRIKIYVNGEQVTFSVTDYPTRYYDLQVNTSTYPVTFGYSGGTAAYFAGYSSDIHFIDGEAKLPTDFIELGDYGNYIPKAYTGSFGTNGFHLDMQPAHDSDLLVSSIDRNDGDTLFADAAQGHTITGSGALHKDTVGNPFDASGTAMFFDGSNDWVQVSTASTDFQFGTGDFTIEGWFYFANLSSAQVICDLRPSNVADSTRPSFNTTGANINMHFNSGNTTVATGGLLATQWQHIAIVRASGSLKVYIDGVLKGTTSFTDDLNTSAIPHIGATNPSPSQEAFLSGYAYDFRITKGTALYTSGFTAPSAAFEVNPVYLGGDQSGNKNHFQPTNISTTDIRTDVPTDSACVMSPVDKGSGVTLSEGNLKAVCNNDWDNVRGTMGATSGKFYYEVVGNIAASTRWNAGVDINQKCQVDTYNNNTGSIVYSLYDGKIYDGAGGNSSATQDQSETNARIGVAVDIDAGKVWFRFNNGSWELSGGDPTSGSSSGSETFTAGSLVQPLFAGYGATFTVYFQESEWTDTAPTDYGEWKTSRLGTPVIKPAENFNTVLYTGTRDNSNSLGATSNPVSGMGFSPELLWIKDRDNQSTNNGSGYSGHWLFDSVQGSGKALNIDGGYYTGSNDFSGNGTGVSSFTSPTGGFTLGDSEAVNFAYDSDYNGSIDTYERYVAWGWKLGESGGDDTWASGNTDPTTEKYNSAAGVSVIRQEESSSSYPMTGVTVNHSLGAEPEFAFLIDVTSNTSDIFAWHKDLDANKYLKLNQTSAQTTGSGYFPSGGSTATTFEIGGDIAGANSMDGYWDIYAYLFSGVEGYSKFGKYTGNGDTTGAGPLVYLGFEPALLMIKRIDSSNNWVILDGKRNPSNTVNLTLQADANSAEGGSSDTYLDFISTGFKVRNTSTANWLNATSGSYIYAAFAESPFKHANAR